MASKQKSAEVVASGGATTLHDKLVEVALETRTVNRGRENESQGYRFAAAFDVQQEVMPKLLQRGILFYPENRYVDSVTKYESKSGASQFLVVHVTKWVATDGKDRIEVSVVGSGTDLGDKGAYKGMTGDMKYAISQLLAIAFTDMDPEEEREDERREPTPLEGLVALSEKASMSKADLKAFVKEHTGKDSSKELTNTEIADLTAKIAANMVGGQVVS